MPKLPSACEGCPLASTAEGFCPPGEIHAHTRLVVWGEAPGRTEIATGHGFTGESGRLLRSWLRRAGLSVASGWPDDMPGSKREDVAFRNAILCKRPKNEWPGKEAAWECMKRHQTCFCDKAAVEQEKTGSLLLPMPSSQLQLGWIAYGANATEALTGQSLPILKVRGSLLPLLNIPGMTLGGQLTTAQPVKKLGIHPEGICRVVGSEPCASDSTESMTSTAIKSTGLTVSTDLVGGSQHTTKPSQLPTNGESATTVASWSNPGWVTASLHPAFLVRGGGANNPNEDQGKAQSHLQPHLGGDARRALEIAAPRIPSVSFLQLPNFLPPKEALVSVDIEGANGQPNIVGVSWEEGQAFVFPWSEEARTFLTALFKSNIPTFHNGAFDIPELEAAGVTPPKVWYDTINMAALYDPNQPMNLQTQVLTHVPGSIAWKGLINHEKGPDYSSGGVANFRALWCEVLNRLGRAAPITGSGWYAHYNGLDTAWGLALANNLKRKLMAQGRWGYYENVLMPLQRPLLGMGARGLPVDEARLAERRSECHTKVREATIVLRQYGGGILKKRAEDFKSQLQVLENERVASGVTLKVWPRTKELQGLRNKYKAAAEAVDEGFNPDSNAQRCALLYEWYGLPPIKNKGAKGFTTDEAACADLLNRLQRGTIKPKCGSVEECKEVLTAMVEAKEWATLERTFLNPELK